MSEQNITCFSLNIHDTFKCLITHGHQHTMIILRQRSQSLLHTNVNGFKRLGIGLVGNNDQRLIMEQGFNVLKQLNLSLQGITTGLRQINKVKHTCIQMCQCGDGLHFNRISMLQRMIQDTRGIDHLPSHVVVISMTHIQRFGGESVGLNLYVGIGDDVHETGLTHVGITGDNQCTCVGINRWQSCKMLSDFLQEHQTGVHLFDNRGHSSQSGTLEHLATIERIGVLHETDVLLGDVVDETFGGVQMTQSQFKMITIV
mmetsp:Transcript_65566/g.75425  ORF Transcript_65566/g.75425 Transcript_65566/m.75425 type:complete len:258 (+) Transcript_65566:1410-2183(+)